ncbi:hypothetical protein MKZ38_003069 [Zalerion maritima]|uniref:SNF-domain-containing protein n=1 Tax=Zalerion maritima TaxID=339359 RepID=A0AAD5RP92_9PEZI|nr:hypothetical protein MKZ38_003069 [Zalerion maritima]
MHPVAGKVLRFFAPEAKKSEDGRDQWPSRVSFIFASMGGAIGLGNLLRYPSVVFANYGLQWFIPYLIALFIIAIPVLTLEIAVGQTYRGGTVVAFDHMGKRLKGVGLSIILNGYFVVVYYVPIIAWVMRYFQNSFQSPLPWTTDADSFYIDEVIANTAPSDPVYDGSTVVKYANYPDTGMIGATAGWCAFVWFVVWLCMFKGVGLTGRAVYFTIGIPIVTVIILIGRACSLDNAVEGIKLYMGQWHGEKLGSGQIWQAAAGQIFFSIGVGFGYFTSYASYNAKYSNAVQDALIISCSNSLFEVVAAFAVFGVIGNLNLDPDSDTVLGTFTVAFLTYPQAIAAMPGANFWAILFFATIFLLGLSSAFALLESIVTMCCDTEWGKNVPGGRITLCTGWVVISFLLSLMFCTEFGFYLLDAIDTYVNNCSLLFVVWCECVLPFALYRHKDVWAEVGKVPWMVYNFAHAGGQIIGVGIGHGVDPRIGAGVGFGIYIVFTIVSLFLAKTPATKAPSFWGKNAFLAKFWWLAFYSGNQLTRDLNVIVGQGKNWSIPVFWSPVIRYISAPILAIIFGFTYSLFYGNRGDPLHIFGFTAAHWIMATLLCGVLFPRWLNFLIPPVQRDSERLQYSTAPAVTLDDTDVRIQDHVHDPADMEVGLDRSSDGQEKKS